MSEEVYTITDKEAEKFAIALLSTRIMGMIAQIAGPKHKDIAAAMGVSSSYVSQLFNGDKLINLEKLHRIQRSKGVEISIAFRAIKDMHLEYFNASVFEDVGKGKDFQNVILTSEKS